VGETIGEVFKILCTGFDYILEKKGGKLFKGGYSSK
jgi:hypothetical protein